MKVVPVIDSCFNNRYFAWGDNPVLRWAANNTKKIRSGVKSGTDTGNYVFAKIEGKSRKTDPFQALVHSMVIEGELPVNVGTYDDIPVIIG
jgi:phage terminase large subunit-like protein